MLDVSMLCLQIHTQRSESSFTFMHLLDGFIQSDLNCVIPYTCYFMYMFSTPSSGSVFNKPSPKPSPLSHPHVIPGLLQLSTNNVVYLLNVSKNVKSPKEHEQTLY